MTYRLCYAVRGKLAFLSHLELLRLWQRTLLRSGLKIRWSEGFNPRPKMSTGPARGVGIVGESEYLDLELATYYRAEEVAEAIQATLPDGIELLRWRELPPGTKTLEAVINEADYTFHFLNGAPDDLDERIGEFMASSSWAFTRSSPKGEKELNLRRFVKDMRADGDIVYLTVSIGNDGALRPQELLTALGYSAIIGDIEIRRCGLYVSKNGQRVTA